MQIYNQAVLSGTPCVHADGGAQNKELTHSHLKLGFPLGVSTGCEDPQLFFRLDSSPLTGTTPFYCILLPVCGNDYYVLTIQPVTVQLMTRTLWEQMMLET